MKSFLEYFNKIKNDVTRLRTQRFEFFDVVCVLFVPIFSPSFNSFVSTKINLKNNLSQYNHFKIFKKWKTEYG
jgi:hypothetical protein